MIEENGKGGYPWREPRLCSVISLVWPGRAFFTTHEGYIGLAPALSKVGDVVCAITGCDRPVLLRPTDHGCAEPFQVVSDCYVQVLMSQEALFGHGSSGFRAVYHYDDATDLHQRFIDETTNAVLNQDPRPIAQLLYELEAEAVSLANSDGLSTQEKVDIWHTVGVPFASFTLI